jgi:Ulp1 family protease
VIVPVKIGSVIIDVIDFQTLGPGEWLNDKV